MEKRHGDDKEDPSVDALETTRWIEATHSNRFPGGMYSFVGALTLALASLRRSIKAMGMLPRRFAETGQSRVWQARLVAFESLAAAVSRSQ